MDSVRLRVQTVLTSDPVTDESHIAFMVLQSPTSAGVVQHAPGWTLRDAIENYCNWFHVERQCIKLVRPFLPQTMEDYVGE